jgi:hypothetical protein
MTGSAISGSRAEHFAPPPSRRRAPEGRERAAAPPRARSISDFSPYAVRPWAKVGPLAIGAVTGLVIVLGWIRRDDEILTPETGLGYWLGIVGGGAMLLLLIYPLRKRIRALRPLGSVAFWFRFHMLLGLTGPVLVLFHANFRLGAINSNVALATMLIVAVSGIFGRYLYGKVHLGLSGRKAEVREVLADAEAIKSIIGDGLPLADQVIAELTAFTQLVMTPPRGVCASLWSASTLAWRVRTARGDLLTGARRIITVEGKRRGWSRRDRRRRITAVTTLVTLHLSAVKKAAAFAFYDRLFAIWHLLHLPLFVLLVLAAAVHIYAAHFY